MKKLIKILNSFVLLSAPATVVVSCSNQEDKILTTNEKNGNGKIKANTAYSSFVTKSLEEQEIMKDLKQLGQEIETKLLTKIIIADGKNTYKTEKEKIKTYLSKLAIGKNITLSFEFVSSVFETEDDIIYKIKNPFEIKIDLISDVNNKLILSKSYKAPVIEGISKDYLEHEAVKEVINNMFANEKFRTKLVRATKVKATGENTVKVMIDSLNKLDNVDIFGRNEKLTNYKFQYTTSQQANDILVVEQVIDVDVNVYDLNNIDTPFLKTKFAIKISGETDEERYNRISEKISDYLSNKEIDLSAFKELDADGKVQWSETLNKIVNSDKVYDYFNFETLGEVFKEQYADTVALELTLDDEKTDELSNTYFAYNSEQHYVSVILKILLGEEKDVNLKIKIGGLTDQQIYQKQEETANKLEELIKTKNFEFTESNFFAYWNPIAWDQVTYKTMLDYFFKKTVADDEEILQYLDINFLITSYESTEKNLSVDDYIFNLMNYDTLINIKTLPKGRKAWNNKTHDIDYHISKLAYFPTWRSGEFFAQKHQSSEAGQLGHIILKKQDAFNNEQLTVYYLWKKINDNLQKFISTSSLYISINEQIKIGIEIGKGDEKYGNDIEKYKNIPLTEGEYKYIYNIHQKHVEKIVTIWGIETEVVIEE